MERFQDQRLGLSSTLMRTPDASPLRRLSCVVRTPPHRRHSGRLSKRKLRIRLLPDHDVCRRSKRRLDRRDSHSAQTLLDVFYTVEANKEQRLSSNSIKKKKTPVEMNLHIKSTSSIFGIHFQFYPACALTEIGVEKNYRNKKSTNKSLSSKKTSMKKKEQFDRVDVKEDF
jgi:hypothetical protein